MSDHGDSERWDSPDEAPEPEALGAPDTVERYEEGGSIVFYDAENPLAWVEASLSVRLSEAM